MAADLKKKKQIRGGHRASTTKRLGEVEEQLAAPTPDISKLLQVKLSLQEKLETLKLLDGEILDMIPVEELDTEIEQADTFKERIYQAMVNIEKHLESPAANLAPPTIAATPRRTDSVKLPKLTLRPFNGEVTRWTTFWDSYESAIHNNPDLTDIDKFNYLNSLLERTALEAISGLALSSANYKEAVKILKKRFGNRQAIISKHMDILLNIDPVTSQHNIKGLRHFYDLVESHVRSLNSLGVSSESYGSLLSSALLNKLPHEIQLIISRELQDEELSLAAIMKAVGKEVEARERTGQNSSSTGKKPEKIQPTATSLLTGNSSLTCCFCQQQGHTSSDCKTVVQAEARKQILLKSGRCFICLRRGHLSRHCHSPGKCTKCHGRHHISICSRIKTTTPSSTTSRQPSTLQNATSSTPTTSQQQSSHPSGLNPGAVPYKAPTTTSMYVSANTTVMLQTARAFVYNPQIPQCPLEVRLILDTGSQKSYVTSSVKNSLSLEPVEKQCMSIVTFGSEQGQSTVCEVVRVGMKMKEGPDKVLTLFTVPQICEPLASQPINFCMERYQHLSGLDLADAASSETQMNVDILIGSDYYWDLTTGETRRGDCGPVAIQTQLGWVLSGPVQAPGPPQTSVNLVTTHALRVDVQQSDTRRLDERLHSFWELESLGIKEPDKSVYEDFGKSIRFIQGRYEVSLPWKDPLSTLPDNQHLCLKRLQSLLHRLKQDPPTLQEYDSIIQDQVRKGIVEVVANPDEGNARVHYLPHHPVIRKDKETTKVRVVYDASARSMGPSLNDCLFTGPKFDQKILDILLRFRVHRVALTADIEKAFLMVSMAEKDRDALRFFWVNDISQEQPDVKVFRFARVVFGVSSSPFLLNATLRHHIDKFASSHPELVRRLSLSMYVDDIAYGADTEEAAYQLYSNSKEILKQGGFNLRKFTTNLQTLQDKIDQNEAVLNADTPSIPIDDESETYTKSTLGTTQRIRSGEQKILGVRWNISADHFAFTLDEIFKQTQEMEPTKRNIVSIVGRFYDPLGFLSPVVIKFKIFFQQLCESKVDWDAPLAGILLKKWHSLIADLQEAQPISFPRCYFDGVQPSIKACSLQGFCDASVNAFAAVVYLLIETDTGNTTKFIASKTRVSPLSKQTIPRLELLSALLLSRLMESVTQSLEVELHMSKPSCFTDSKVALFWIQGVEKEWKPFVQNRVNSIRKLLPIDCWKHCPGKDNPADIPSRGLAPLELSVNTLWREGPSWLTDNSANDESLDETMPEECFLEMRAKDQHSVHNLLAADSTGISKVMKCEDFSSLSRLLRVTSYVLKFINQLKKKIRPSGETKQSASEVDKITRAERLWIIASQTFLTTHQRFPSWKKQFDLFLDSEGFWRCRGRLSNADVPYSTRYPILLLKGHHFTKLVVRRAHDRVLHDGVKETLTEVRAKFWIVKGRSYVRQIIYRCVCCRRFEGKPYGAPPPPPLPNFRVKEHPPFTYTGVDFAGPLYVRNKDSTQSQKVWICLYTCCIVRAVHLDIIPDMSTQTFIRCLKRFAARRGLPRKIVSDNGRTFKAAAKVIETVMRNDEVKQYLSGVGVEWVFNLEKAPWWGGIFERMVRSTKRCLKKMIGQAVFSYDELLTAITEVESIINSRPISYVSSHDLEEPLTPSHLLHGRRLLSLPDNLSYEDEAGDEDFEIDTTHLNRRVKHLNSTLNQFWRRWRAEYLLELRDSHRYSKKRSSKTIAIGDIVVVHNEEQPRGFWKLAKVEDTIVGADGNVRGAVLRLPEKNGRQRRLQRPLQKLYPLEVNCSFPDAQTVPNSSNNSNTTDDQDVSDRNVPDREIVDNSIVDDTEQDVIQQDASTLTSTSTTTGRPKRAAASRAQSRIQALIQDI